MAGAPCPVELMREVVTRLHMPEVAIGYGMTETAPLSTLSARDDAVEKRVGTVGRVMPHVEVKLVDPATGLVKPASESFGPGFAERALTNGKGRFAIGVNYQHLALQSYEGTDLENGDLAFVLQHNDCCPSAGGGAAGASPDDPPFEGDLVRMSLSLNLKTDIVAPFFSYGVNNRWDVGVIVPIVHVSLNPTITSTIDRVATCPGGTCTGLNQLIHSWNGQGQTTKTETLSGSASGIGDVVLRTKYRFADATGGGFAGGLDVRLPTGDKENLLGTGAVQTKVYLIASAELSKLAPHVNFGFTHSSGDISTSLTSLPSSSQPANAATQTQINAATGVLLADTHLPNEINFFGGVDYAAHPLVTLSADLIGRTFLDTERFAMVSRQFAFRTVAGGPISNETRSTFDTTGSGSLTSLLGVVGAKLNLTGTPFLLTANVLFPLNHSGLSPKVTPVFGLEYSFKFGRTAEDAEDAEDGAGCQGASGSMLAPC